MSFVPNCYRFFEKRRSFYVFTVINFNEVKLFVREFSAI